MGYGSLATTDFQLSGIMAPDMSALFKLALVKLAPCRLANCRLANCRLANCRLAKLKSTPDKS